MLQMINSFNFMFDEGLCKIIVAPIIVRTISSMCLFLRLAIPFY
jgi:hypothetical protein